MAQGLRFNMPPGWPAQPEGWRPEPGWQPDPSWPPAPADWEFWVPASTSSPEPAFALPSSPRPDTQPPGMIQVPGAATPAYPSYQAPLPSGGSYQAVAGPPAPSNPQATASLVLGIVSMFASALFVTAIVGVVLGIVGLARSGRTDPPIGRGKAITGIALSVLSAVLGFADLSQDVKLGTADRIQADWASLPATVTNSSSQTFTYLVDVVAESKDGSTSYGTGTGLAENLEPGQRQEVAVDFFDEIPADAVFRIESVDRFQE